MNENYVIHKAVDTEDGDSVRVKRLFPVQGFSNYDPFVLLDEFFVDSKSGFPTHPHRGFEAITYMLDGSFRHQDNLGNDTTVSTGGIQRFTAGSGMTHSEMPMTEGINHGFQLWINLSKRLKQMDPDYQQVNKSEIPEKNEDGIIIKTIVGEGSPVSLQTHIIYQDITLDKNKSYSFNLDQGFNGFVYLMEGLLDLSNRVLNPSEALFLKENESLTVQAQETSRFIYLAGKAHNEPIRQWGPFVD